MLVAILNLKVKYSGRLEHSSSCMPAESALLAQLASGSGELTSVTGTCPEGYDGPRYTI